MTAALLVAVLCGTAEARTARVSSVAIAFTVKNTNTAIAPCTPDGATYTVRGHITGPRSFKRPGATLYLHGLGLGEWLWNFQPVRSYSFVRGMARECGIGAIVEDLARTLPRPGLEEVQAHPALHAPDVGDVDAMSAQFADGVLTQRIVGHGADHRRAVPEAREGHRDVRFRAADMDIEPRVLQQDLAPGRAQAQEQFTKTCDVARCHDESLPR